MSRMKYVVLVVSGILGACASSAAQNDDPNTITRTEFAQLRWLEGTWRGSGVNQAPFYERYHFTNDTTLTIDTYTDSTLARVSDTSIYMLAGGKIANTNPKSRWEASKLTDRAVTFSPIFGARNTFVWQRENENAWTAILLWPATNAQPAGERIYNMVRMR
jgi:hypothetical protein